jgi:hypothetical protein
MKQQLYTNCDLQISESYKMITVNPKGFRFYGVDCEDQSSIYRDATLSLDKEGNYCVEGEQTFYTKHRESSVHYETLLCKHPQELITKHSFLGIVWYKAKGVMKREARARYVGKHKAYQIHERLEFLSHTCTQGD